MAQSLACCQCLHAPPSAALCSPLQQQHAPHRWSTLFSAAKFSNRSFSNQASRRWASSRISCKRPSDPNKSSENPEPDANKDSNKNSVNWDGAWSSFTKSIQGGQKQMESYVERPRARPPPKFARNEKEDETRRIENSALNVWTDERFFKAGVVIVGLFLIFVVIVVGPPPSH